VAATLSPARLLAEARAIVERFPDQARCLPLSLGCPTFEASFVVGGLTRHVRMSLPPGYPSLPPEVREIDAPRGRILAPLGAPYRLADGVLCLFPHGNDPQGWRPDRRAVEALERCRELFEREQAASAPRPLAFAARDRLFIAPGAAQWLRLPRGSGTMELRRGGAGGGDWFVAAIAAAGYDVPVLGLGPSWLAVMPTVGHSAWLRVPLAGASWSDVLQDGATLRARLRNTLPTPLAERVDRAETLVLVRDESDVLDARMILRSPSHVGALFVSDVVVDTPDGVLFQRADGVLPDRTRLAEVQIVQIGLGSLGGAVALALARAGCRRFVLVDPDRLTLDNVSRHVGTVHQIGQPKVDVVAAAIRAVNPEAEVELCRGWLAWDIPGWGAGQEFEQVLARPRPSIVVTTCAVGTVERQINAVAVPRGVPAIYASVLGAAEHGRIFRVVPGASACYECVRLAQRRAPDAFPRFVAEDADNIRPYVAPSLPGLAIDIGQIALIAARLTLQTLARVLDLDLGFADESGDHLLWTNRGGWGFDRPLQVEIVRVPRAADCSVCAVSAAAASLTAEEDEELRRLFDVPWPVRPNETEPDGTT